MKLILGISFTSVLLLAEAGLSAQEPEVKFNNGAIRSEFVGSQDLPDAIAFLSVLRLIRTMSTNDALDPTEYIKREMRVDENTAKTLVNAMVAVLSEVEEEIRTTSREFACPSGLAVAQGEEVHEVFDTLDDLNESVAAARLLRFETVIGADNFDRFMALLSKEKRSISHTRLDHKKAHENSGRNPDDLISDFCQTSIR